MQYASLEDFETIIHILMTDPQEHPLPMTLGEETAILSLMLRVYVLPDVTDDAANLIRELCDKIADEIIRRYPFSEGYIDYLYGAAALGRHLH